MNIQLFINNAPKEKVDKTSDLVLVMDMDGTFRNAVSILSPSFVIEYSYVSASEIVDSDSLDVVDGDGGELVDTAVEDSFPVFNYAYIPALKRYYFVNDCVVQNGFATLSLSVDVLMSYKDSIFNLSAVVDRNEYDFDANLEDKKIPFVYPKEVTETVLDNSSGYVNFNFSVSNLGISAKYFLLTTLTDHPYAGNVIIDKIPSVAGLPEIATGRWLNSGEIAHTYAVDYRNLKVLRR